MKKIRSWKHSFPTFLIWSSFWALYFSLIVAAGCSEKNNPPDFQLNLNPPQVEGLTVTVNGGVVRPVVRIQWDWGDGSVDHHLYFPATHTYAQPGRYTITVTVFDDKNFSVSKSIIADIQP